MQGKAVRGEWQTVMIRADLLLAEPWRYTITPTCMALMTRSRSQQSARVYRNLGSAYMVSCYYYLGDTPGYAPEMTDDLLITRRRFVCSMLLANMPLTRLRPGLRHFYCSLIEIKPPFE